MEDRTQPSFLAPVNYAVGLASYDPYAVVTADFNGDGRLDLAVANVYSNTVSVLLGNPDGTFQPALYSDTGPLPTSLAVGDFNADGKLDLATTNAYGVSVLLGKGDGTFQPPSNIDTIGLGYGSVAVGDFNADGKLDLTVVSDQSDYYGTYGFADVLLGHGDGSFSEPNPISLGSWGYTASVAVGDFNGDGKLDLATASAYGVVSVLLNDGSGSLQAPTRFYMGGTPVAVVAGDVNGDGNTDLVAANGNENGYVSVLLGTGLGAFGTAQNYATGIYPHAVELGDFNNDGKLDIATDYSDDETVLLGRGDGTFAPPRSSAVGPGIRALASGDFNGDGWLDVATARWDGSYISVLINDTYWPPADAPSVTVSDVSVTEGNTGTVGATFTVRLSPASDQPVTVHYATADGTATAGSDYTAGAGDVTFAPGETSKTISVAVLGDRLGESNETFFVNLSNPTNAMIADSRGQGTIVDDEPRIAINDVSVTEGNTGTVSATFVVSLSAACDQPVTVHFTTADGSALAGSDYVAVSGNLTFEPGQTTRTITVAVLGDRVAEANETFVVNLSSASSNSFIDDSQGVGTILDNEPRITINYVAKKEGKSGTTLLVFTVFLSAAYDQPVTVNFATSDGTAKVSDHDYQAQSGTLTFAPGQTTRTISVAVYGDTKKEADEWFFVNLSSPSSNALLLGSMGIGTIYDDDHHR